jgi:hypothetical protein
MKYTVFLASLSLLSSLAQAEPARLAEVDLGGITAGVFIAPPQVELDVSPNISVGAGLGANVISGIQVPLAVSGTGNSLAGAGQGLSLANNVFGGGFVFGK